jgi:hypothetical protein
MAPGEQRLSAGQIVHYVSHGTPPRPDGSQAFLSVCRAAIVTEVGENDVIGLCAVNPTGLFFHSLKDGGAAHEEDEHPGGSWHWPERV